MVCRFSGGFGRARYSGYFGRSFDHSERMQVVSRIASLPSVPLVLLAQGDDLLEDLGVESGVLVSPL